MINYSQFVKNPLTIIGVFASIIEVCGNCVLPQLNEECQFYYMWFLMIFPFLLVICFFVVLWFKPKNLYAPSDFQDENNFIKCMFPASPQDILNQKIQDIEFEKSVNDATDQKGNHNNGNTPIATLDQPTENNNHNHCDRLRKYLAVENAVMDYVSRKYQTTVTREIGIQCQFERIFFDGFFYQNDKRYFLEVKYVTRLVLIKQHIDLVTKKIMRSKAILPTDTLLLIFVYSGDVKNIKSKINIPQNLPFNLKVEYFNEKELCL